MEEDDIIIQPGTPKAEDADQEEKSETSPDDANNPRVFDFSSDFNISPVADEQPAPKPSVPSPVPPVITPPPPASFIPPVPQPIPTVPEAKPAASYREPVEKNQNWPFAFGASGVNQPMMNPSATASSPDITALPTGKRSPMSQPVKTIRAEGGEQAAEKDIPRPSGGLQRDISAILPNLKKEDSAADAPRSPAQSFSSNPNIKPLRTYEGDMAEVLSHRNISSASIAIAENKRKTGEERLGNREENAKNKKAEETFIPPVRTEPPVVKPQPRENVFAQKPISEGFKGAVIAARPAPPSHAVRNLSLIILSLIFIGGGVTGAYYLYSHSMLSSVRHQQTPVTPAQTISSKSLIPSESQVAIATDGQSTEALTARILAEIAKPQNPNTIKEILLTQNVANVQKQIAPGDIARRMSLPVPDVILRTLQPKWMLGVYADASGAKNIFVAATTDTFQNAFPGMLNWESAMPHDLNSYINAGTSTPLQGRFIDEVVRNKDVRAFVTPASEQSVFIYSFLNNSMLVFSNSEVALSEIITRLENQTFVR